MYLPTLLILAGCVVAELPPRYRDRVVRLIEPGDPLVTQALEARGPGWSIARGNTCRDRGVCGREAHIFTTFIACLYKYTFIMYKTA